MTLTVSELNDAVKTLLEGDIRFTDLCVQGELSNYKIYPSGHHYFTLKDQESSLRCVMFRGNASRLRFRPENGMKVFVFGSLRVYPRDGAYQLYTSNIVPDGIGDLQIAFEQLKQRLEAEGLFEPSRKKALPPFPERVAIITSSAGAAVHDMIRIFRQRWPMTKLILLPVRVQGTEAPAEIASAIRYANRHHVADLIITGRGGGSLEDLWAFNDERVARAIYASEIPVISAVGHEPDVTISDYVADRRASTPSNAAEIAVPDYREIQDVLTGFSVRMNQAVSRQLLRQRQQLESLRSRRVLADASSFVDIRRMELDHILARLSSAGERMLLEKRAGIGGLSASLDALSPLKVLARGYAAASDGSGKTLKSVRQLSPGDRIGLRLADGRAACLVEQLEER
ncbi:MAG: exodeoxyribonuclease VII large subunit [Oscillospiraceae bacterium]|nr:exodeoxyribonuclease VII large subunit [Oscillospiraceae bacterium]